MIRKRKIARLFESRRSQIDARVSRDFVKNGIATIPCRVNDYNDVFTSYSVKGFETLNPDFVAYIREATSFTPSDCPIVLNIIGNWMSQEEKKTIENVILDDFAYDLGLVEKDEKRHKRIFIFMIIGLVISGILLWFTESTLSEVPRELIFVFFWFVADTLIDYILLTGYDLRRDRRFAGRLASISVVFSDTYEAPDYSEHDVNELYARIEKDVEASINEDD